MKTPEGILRNRISGLMAGVWVRTWHEDRAIEPGVPDLSFVMRGGEFETGWLELKAEREGPPFKFEIRSTQHQWISRHCELVPVYFLLAADDMWYIVHGSHHARLSERIDYATLGTLAIWTAKYPIRGNAFDSLVHTLQTITRRGRNGEVCRI